MADNEICEVHNIRLVPMKVRISYGMPAFDESFTVADKLFPNAYRYVIGGCLVDESFPRLSEEMVCRECRKAETIWKKKTKNFLIGCNESNSELKFVYGSVFSICLR